MKKYNILIVDDEKRLIQCMVFVLSLEGHNVMTADNGDDAFCLLKEARENGRQIDLLITDVFMPKMTGANLMDKLIAEKMNLTTIGISGAPNNEIMTELHDRGCAALISKPFTPDELLSTIHQVMNVE